MKKTTTETNRKIYFIIQNICIQLVIKEILKTTKKNKHTFTNRKTKPSYSPKKHFSLKNQQQQNKISSCNRTKN